jgi:hypothetical protein
MHVIKQTGTANTTYSPGRKIKYLAIHYTAGVSCKAGSASGSASWFSNPDAGGAADYIVDEGGLVQYNPDPRNRYCHAVGGGRYNTKGGRLYGVAKNSNCISLEICSGNHKGRITVPNDPAYYFTTAVIAKAIEATQYIMDQYGIDADHVIRHYDCNGKCCPGVIGWNKDSGSETAWEAFHKSIGGSPIVWYRVRYAWDQPDTQLDAFTDLGRAKACADAHPGFSVYDGDGKCLYTSKPKPIKELTAKNLTGTEEQKIKQVAPIYQEVMKDTGMLASVGLAQFCLESGYGTTDLAKEANNMHGMKCSLSGNTWDGSVWDGHSSYGKYSPEVYNGKTVMVYSEFRKYPSIYKSVQDRAAYFIGAWLDAAKTRHRYPNVNMIKEAEEQVRLLKAGGYATDPNYVSKLLNIIRRFDLTQYDKGIVPDIWSRGDATPEPKPEPQKQKAYRVRVGIYRQQEYLAALRQKIKDALNLDCFTESHEDGIHIFCGSFSSLENARAREKILNNAEFETSIVEC